MDPTRDVILAVDIGGTKFAAGLMTIAGELLDRAVVPVDHDVGPESHFAALAGIVDAARAGRRPPRGASSPRRHRVGRTRSTRHCETVSPVNIPAWREFPLRATLRELTGLPVYGDLDAKALALAEGWLGAAQGRDNFLRDDRVDRRRRRHRARRSAARRGDRQRRPRRPHDRRAQRPALRVRAAGLPRGRGVGPGDRGDHRAARRPSRPTRSCSAPAASSAAPSASVCNLLDLELVVVGGGVALGFAATFFNAAQEELDAARARLPYSRHGPHHAEPASAIAGR